jgi:hypothetical protein
MEAWYLITGMNFAMLLYPCASLDTTCYAKTATSWNRSGFNHSSAAAMSTPSQTGSQDAQSATCLKMSGRSASAPRLHLCNARECRVDGSRSAWHIGADGQWWLSVVTPLGGNTAIWSSLLARHGPRLWGARCLGSRRPASRLRGYGMIASLAAEEASRTFWRALRTRTLQSKCGTTPAADKQRGDCRQTALGVISQGALGINSSTYPLLQPHTRWSATVL